MKRLIYTLVYSSIVTQQLIYRARQCILLISSLIFLLSPTGVYAQCQLFFSDGDLWRATGTGRSIKATILGGSIEAIYLDATSQELFWFDSRLRKSTLGSSYVTEFDVRYAFLSPESMLVSSDQEFVYWRTSGAIYVSRLDGTDKATELGPGGRGFGITIDQQEETLFFGTSWGISRIGTDGSGQTVISEYAPFNWVRAIVLNPRDGMLYWIHAQAIWRGPKEGGPAELLADGIELDLPNGAFALTVDSLGEKLYWVDRSGTAIMKANLDGTGQEIFLESTTKIIHLAFNSEDNTLIYAKPCEIFSVTSDSTLSTSLASCQEFLDVEVNSSFSQKLYYSSPSGRAIFRADTTGGNMERILSNLGEPSGIAIDTTDRMIYWGDGLKGTISRAELDGTASEVVLEGLESIGDVEISETQRKLYWSENGAEGAVLNVSALDGTGRETLVRDVKEIRGIDVDALGSRVFWVEWSDVGSHEGAIRYLQLAGSTINTIVELPVERIPHPRFGVLEFPSSPRAVIFDEQTNKVLWSKRWQPQNSAMIERANLDGSNREVLERGGTMIRHAAESLALSDRSFPGCEGSFDVSNVSELVVWRPSTGTWYAKGADGYSAHPQNLSFQWGLPSDVPLSGDYDGDGFRDFAVWRPHSGTWYICNSSYDPSCQASRIRQFGLAGDYPLVGDLFDEDGLDLIVWRPIGGSVIGQWFVYKSTNEILPPPFHRVSTFQWGLPGDIPFVSDFDGDRTSDIGVWRPSDGTWHISLHVPGVNSSYSPEENYVIVRQWGLPGDHPLPGDYDGDGRSDLVVWRPTNGTWYVCSSKTEHDCSNARQVQFGLPGDQPVRADFDGDGILDFTVWRPFLPPVIGQWYYRRSSDGIVISEQWGLPGDIPLGTGVD
jgi:hypothetical protein